MELSLLEANLPLTWSVVDPDKQYVARITVGDCIKQNLEAYHCPLPENPNHGHIWGLVEMRGIDEDQYERAIDALARASTIVPYNA